MFDNRERQVQVQPVARHHTIGNRPLLKSDVALTYDQGDKFGIGAKEAVQRRAYMVVAPLLPWLCIGMNSQYPSSRRQAAKNLMHAPAGLVHKTRRRSKALELQAEIKGARHLERNVGEMTIIIERQLDIEAFMKSDRKRRLDELE